MTDALATTTSIPAGTGTNSGDTAGISSNYGSAMTLGANGQGVDTALTGMPIGGMRGSGLAVYMALESALRFKAVSLMRDYHTVNENEYNYTKAIYQAPAAASASEVTSPVTNPKYAVDTYASTPAGMSTAKITDKQWFQARRRMHRYATGAQDRLDYDFAILRTSALISGWNMGRRYEQAWADAHNERRISRQVAIMNVGIAAGNIARQGLATAVEGLGNAYTGIEDSLSAVGNGMFAAKGVQDGKQYAKTAYKQKGEK